MTQPGSPSWRSDASLAGRGRAGGLLRGRLAGRPGRPGAGSQRCGVVTTWPAHCVVGTSGAQLQSPLTEDAVDAVVRKGGHTAAYSAFEGTVEGTPLADWLRDRGIDELDVCGIATDHCVRASVLDARAAGLLVRVLLDVCVGVAPTTTAAALEAMSAAGAELIA